MQEAIPGDSSHHVPSSGVSLNPVHVSQVRAASSDIVQQQGSTALAVDEDIIYRFIVPGRSQLAEEHVRYMILC